MIRLRVIIAVSVTVLVIAGNVLRTTGGDRRGMDLYRLVPDGGERLVVVSRVCGGGGGGSNGDGGVVVTEEREIVVTRSHETTHVRAWETERIDDVKGNVCEVHR